MAPSNSRTSELSHAGGLFQLLRDGRPRTRADLVRSTGLSRPTVADRVDQLLGLGLIAEVDGAASTGGRPSSRFAFNARARVVIAADFGASHSRIAVTTLAGGRLRATSSTRDIAAGPRAAISWLRSPALVLLERAGRGVDADVGSGSGLPGPVKFSTGRPINPPIMPGWDRIDV